MDLLIGFVAGIALVKAVDWVREREALMRQDGIGDADDYKVGGTD